jgi:hypothetical protein
VGQLRSILRHYGKITIFWKTRSIFIFSQSHFRVHKVLFITIVALVGVFLSQRAAAAEPLQKVRIGYPSSAVSTLPFDIAKEKGFYPKAGLDVEYIQMRTARRKRSSTAISISSRPPSLGYRRLFQGYL